MHETDKRTPRSGGGLHGHSGEEGFLGLQEELSRWKGGGWRSRLQKREFQNPYKVRSKATLSEMGSQE